MEVDSVRGCTLVRDISTVEGDAESEAQFIAVPPLTAEDEITMGEDVEMTHTPKATQPGGVTSLPYKFTKKRGDGEVEVSGTCALTDSTKKMTVSALKACISALDAAAGISRTPPSCNKPGLKRILQERRREAQTRMEVGEDERMQQAEREAAEMAEAGVKDATEEEEQTADGEQNTALPLDKTQRIRAARRASEMWAANMLVDDNTFRQPCMLPLLDTVPFKLREKVCRLYVRCCVLRHGIYGRAWQLVLVGRRGGRRGRGRQSVRPTGR